MSHKIPDNFEEWIKEETFEKKPKVYRIERLTEKDYKLIDQKFIQELNCKKRHERRNY